MAQADFFLKIKGIDGESTDKHHKGQIDIMSFSWGATNAGASATGGGAGAGKVSFQDLHVSSYVSKASPKLMLACAGGDHIGEAILYVRKAGKTQQEFYNVKLTNVLISSYQSAAHSENPRPTDSFSLNFSAIEFEYKEQKDDGTLGGAIKTHWDIKTNTGG